jgi:hypothetical protein
MNIVDSSEGEPEDVTCAELSDSDFAPLFKNKKNCLMLLKNNIRKFSVCDPVQRGFVLPRMLGN